MGVCLAFLLPALGGLGACKPRKATAPASTWAWEEASATREIRPAIPELAARSLKAGEGACPAAAAGGGSAESAVTGPGGCLEVREAGWDRTVTLRYAWAAPRRPGTPVVVFLHGGPGGSLSAYEGMDVFRELGATHDVLFYDQRGGGHSSPLAGSDAKPAFDPSGALAHHFVAHHLADLEALRANVVREPRIVVMGHSFGAHLALAYATAFPSRVSSVLAHNGAADATGFVTQSTLRIRMFDGIAESTLGKSTYSRLKEMEGKGELRRPGGGAAKGLFSDLHPLLYTFDGQTKELPERMLAYARASGVAPKAGDDGLLALMGEAFLAPLRGSDATFPHSEDASFFPVPAPLGRKRALALDDDPGVPAPAINDVANQWVVCGSLVTPRAIGKVAEPFRPIPTARRGVRCKDYPAVTATFDVVDKLANVKVPVLLTGGSHDPLIPYSLQARDFEQLSKHNRDVSLVVFDESGHNPDENEACFGKSIVAFARGRLPKGKVTCEAIGKLR